MGTLRVYNDPGSSRWPKPSCSCNTWIEHWKNNANLKLQGFCRRCRREVGEENLVGGHVEKYNSDDKRVYIIPICEDCNKSRDTDPFEVDNRVIVLANANYCKNIK